MIALSLPATKCHYVLEENRPWRAARGLCRRSRGGQQAALCELPHLSEPHVAAVPLARALRSLAGPRLGKCRLFGSSLQGGVRFCESLP